MYDFEHQSTAIVYARLLEREGLWPVIGNVLEHLVLELEDGVPLA